MVEHLGLRIHISDGEFQTVLGLIGDTTSVDIDLVESLEIVDSVKRVTEPFKCCNRKFHPEDMVVEIGDVNNYFFSYFLWIVLKYSKYSLYYYAF